MMMMMMMMSTMISTHWSNAGELLAEGQPTSSSYLAVIDSGRLANSGRLEAAHSLQASARSLWNKFICGARARASTEFLRLSCEQIICLSLALHCAARPICSLAAAQRAGSHRGCSRLSVCERARRVVAYVLFFLPADCRICEWRQTSRDHNEKGKHKNAARESDRSRNWTASSNR